MNTPREAALRHQVDALRAEVKTPGEGQAPDPSLLASAIRSDVPDRDDVFEIRDAHK